VCSSDLQYFFPQPEWIIDAVHEKITPLKGHIVRNDFSSARVIRLNSEGV
jgi:2-oxoisovalerate dehydrogenase E1 component